MSLTAQSLTLVASFVAIILFRASPFAEFIPQAVGGLVLLYFLASIKSRKRINFLSESPFTLFALNSATLLLILETGGLGSPLFFVLYFILFGIGFIFQPPLVFVFTALSAIIFLPQALIEEQFMNFLRIGSIILLSPLSYFIGAQIRQDEFIKDEIITMRERAKDSADTISKDIEIIIKDQKKNLSAKDIEKANEILEETETLREEKEGKS